MLVCGSYSKESRDDGVGYRTHQSTAPVWPLCVTSSGAKYSGVPHRVYVFCPTGSFFAKPKSAIFKYPSVVMSRFSGFKSL